MKRLPQLLTPISDNQAQEFNNQQAETDVRAGGVAQWKYYLRPRIEQKKPDYLKHFVTGCNVTG